MSFKGARFSMLLFFGLVAFITIHVSSVFALTPSNTTKISRITGATKAGETILNPNNTDTNYRVLATDLGIMWDAGGGKIMVLFGDTYGIGWDGDGGGPNSSSADWRSNVLATSTDTNLSDGLSFTTMITDTPGHAKEIISSAKDLSGNGEWTTIPSSGVLLELGTMLTICPLKIGQVKACG